MFAFEMRRSEMKFKKAQGCEMQRLTQGASHGLSIPWEASLVGAILQESNTG
jgi:hypothetical protein